ncbi:branched-chain amino acid ABC transporter permease [Rhizobium sp. RU36D]|uniref:branched-chain amino acid ABC transporter permease n=1 Tax=Rhizobium sp. RU36D TaxID=1907415 RepID=UPI0009D90F91|nr:branched-chain amino acid ABC transporter permease [Rhizobium sp. RU36D]SMD06738.1 amino acid/amide ABC transporter membrane protein 1, HAAT family [Rhizobium sp. RU36D]
MAYLAQQLANAVPLAALYAALAYGYAIAFGMTRRADIAYGAFFAFAGQIYLLFAEMGWNRLYLILPAALALGAVVAMVYTLGAGYWIARYVMRPLHRASPNAVIVAALALMVVLSESTRIAMDSRTLWLSPFLNVPVTLFEEDGFRVTLTVIQLGNAAIMVGLIALGQAVLLWTRAGLIWRAVADDPQAAALCGVDAGAVFILSYVAASGMAGICGILATSYYGTMDIGAGMMFGLKVVLIAAAGGHGVPWRSALGAAIVGLAETLWSSYAPILWRDLVVISALVAVLVVSRRERAIP